MASVSSSSHRRKSIDLQLKQIDDIFLQNTNNRINKKIVDVVVQALHCDVHGVHHHCRFNKQNRRNSTNSVKSMSSANILKRSSLGSIYDSQLNFNNSSKRDYISASTNDLFRSKVNKIYNGGSASGGGGANPIVNRRNSLNLSNIPQRKSLPIMKTPDQRRNSLNMKYTTPNVCRNIGHPSEFPNSLRTHHSLSLYDLRSAPSDVNRSRRSATPNKDSIKSNKTILPKKDISNLNHQPQQYRDTDYENKITSILKKKLSMEDESPSVDQIDGSMDRMTDRSTTVTPDYEKKDLTKKLSFNDSNNNICNSVNKARRRSSLISTDDNFNPETRRISIDSLDSRRYSISSSHSNDLNYDDISNLNNEEV